MRLVFGDLVRDLHVPLALGKSAPDASPGVTWRLCRCKQQVAAGSGFWSPQPGRRPLSHSRIASLMSARAWGSGTSSTLL